MNAKKYLISLATATGILLTFVIALNATVDPLAKFRLSDHIYYSAERELKPRLAKAHTYDGLIIGNSKVTYIQTDDLSRHGKILNAGFSGAHIEEIRYFLEETNPDVKWVGLGLDYGMFNAGEIFHTRDGKYFNNQKLADQLEYLIATGTLRYSLKSLKKRLKGKRQRYTPLGARNKKHRVETDREKPSAYQVSLNKMEKSGWVNFQYSSRKIAELKKIKQWADNKGIILVAWLNPYEKGVWKIVERRLGENVELIRNEINIILPNFADLSTEYQNFDDFWKEHPIHYYPATGARFFSDKVFPMIKVAKK